MRRLWADFIAAFWRGYEAARTPPTPTVISNHIPAVTAREDAVIAEAVAQARAHAEAPPRMAGPVSWPEDHEWVHLEITCEVCGDSVQPFNVAWLLAHAGSSLTCPICRRPTNQPITYEASA